MRRRLAAIFIISTLMVLLAAPAAFAAQARISQPSDTMREPAAIRVAITRDSPAEPISGAQIRLRRDGETLGGWVEMSCRQSCEDRDTEQVWAPTDDRRFDPATGAPFVSNGPLPNGDYQLEVRVQRGRFLDPVRSSREVRLVVPPSAPGEVTAERDGDEVRVAWRKAPEPDITGYRVERRSGDGWDDVDTTSKASYVDEPGPGSYGYRVVAIREDGRGGTLETASAEREVEVPDPDNRDDEDDRGNGGGGSGDGDGGGSGSGGNGDDEAGGGSDADESDDEDRSPTAAPENPSGDSSDSSSSRPRRSPTRTPSIGSDSDGIPSVFGRDPETADPDAFAEELDYGSAQEDTDGDGDVDADDDVVLSTGRGGGLGRMLESERAATPIAVGLVLTATGLHLWRWLRVPAL